MKKSRRKTRIRACELAAAVIGARTEETSIVPMCWSLAVFFENYIDGGARSTRKEFGPSKPVPLKTVAK